MKGIVVAIVCLSLCKDVVAKRNQIIELTDNNWRQCLTGEWMIKFYAPWCPACQANEPQFQEFSEWSDELNIKVAIVDITKEPGLSGRFMVTALPTFYHGRDGEFRRYNNDRSAAAMEEYIESKSWQAYEPISWLRHPDSIQMTVMSALFKTSVIMKNIHETITETYGYSAWTSYAVFGLGTLLTGLTLGLLLVCIVDFLFPAKQVTNTRASKLREASEEKTFQSEEKPNEESDQYAHGERPTQKTVESQDWETIQDSEVKEVQMRKRHVKREEAQNTAEF